MERSRLLVRYSALHNKWDSRVSQKEPHLPVIGISVTAMWLHNNPSSTHFHRVREQFTIWSTDRNIHHKIFPHYSYHCTVSSCQNTMDMLTIPTWRWECVRTTGHVTRVNSPFRHTGDRIFAFQSLNYYAKHCIRLDVSESTSCSPCEWSEQGAISQHT